jgi:cystathionine beta-synthase
MVRLHRYPGTTSVSLFAKLESANPGGSIKDRVARYILCEAMRRGRVKPGDTVVEFSSGNTAIGMAMVSAVLGLKALIVASQKTSREKRAVLEAFGAEVIMAEAGHSPDHPSYGLRVAQRLAKERNGFYFDQFHNPLNAQAHYLSTGPEIWQQMQGKVDVLVAGIGTGGTISGTARFLKERCPQLHVVAVDPLGSIFADYIAGRKLRPSGDWLIEGIGSDMICRAMDPTVIDQVITVPDQAAIQAMGQAAATEGLSVGGSAGAALYAALQVAQDRPGGRMAVIIPDAADRYLSKFNGDNDYGGPEVSHKLDRTGISV